MRLLFVAGTTTGGSAVSTRELATALAARGHAVGIIERQRVRPRTGLVVPVRDSVTGAVADTTHRLARGVRRVAPARAGVPERFDGVDVWSCETPHRVLDEVCDAFRPDVVIAGSVARNAWTAVRSTVRARGIPSVLYVREAATLEHVPVADLMPDLVITNSEVLRDVIVEAGLAATVVPSIIDFARCTVESTRKVVLFVNPIWSRGLDVAVGLAAANPDVVFAFQRSWPLDARDDRALRAMVHEHHNVDLRDYETDPARVYRDTRILLLPYLVDQRPRVVAEAQWNGIPVLASDLPGHREAVGDGGCFVAHTAAVDTWNDAFHELWDDDDALRRFGEAARAHASRSELDAERVVTTFESLMADVVASAIPADR